MIEKKYEEKSLEQVYLHGLWSFETNVELQEWHNE